MSGETVDERFIPGTSRITEIESFHRYHVAAALCGGRRVLDAACGEGYGSDILARSAGDVTGIDLCAEAVEAANRKYGRDNLHFVVGDVLRLPFDDASFDRVVSFETVEHVKDPRQFLSEIRRVLKPDGVLVMSSPNKTPFDHRNCRDGKTNPYHVSEMEADEFVEMLRTFFPHVVLHGQDAFYNSVIGGAGSGRLLVKDERGEMLSHEELRSPQYSLALASAVECPPLEASRYVDAFFDDQRGYCLDDEAVVNQFGLRREFEKACARVRESESEINAVRVTCEGLTSSLTEAQGRIAGLTQALAAAQAEQESVADELSRTRESLAECRRTLASTQDNLAEKCRLLASTQDDLAEKCRLLASTQDNLAEKCRLLVATEEELMQTKKNAQMIGAENDARRETISRLTDEVSGLRSELAKTRAALQEEHAKAEYLYYVNNELKNAWSLRIFGRFSIRKHVREASLWFGTKFHRLAKSVFLALPIGYTTRWHLKDMFYAHLGFLFKNVRGYQDWCAIREAIAGVQRSGDTGLIVPKDVPLTSIVIPVYNHLALTMDCLRSIYTIGSKSPFEVIVVDDCSTENQSPIAREYPAVRLLRNEKNLGFLRTANRGGAAAKGEYVIFLNNDTIVLPGWLDELTTALYHHPEAGMIGSQLIHMSTKRLQESGNLICRDGRILPLGRGEAPEHPEFNYFREVDFSSAASIILRKRVFDEMKGFDTAYAPAYFEDPDLALRMQKAGYHNYVMPLSRVMHQEMASYGATLDERCEKNRKFFEDRWLGYLKEHALYDTPQSKSEMMKFPRPRILYIDAETPMADRGSGGMDAIFFMEYFLKRGYDVVFHGEYTPGFVPKYTNILLRMGVECVYAPERQIWEYIASNGWTFQLLFVSRIYQARCFDGLLKQHCPHASYIFNTVDVHFVREKLEADLKGDPELQRQAELTKQYELQVAGAADATIVISKDEEKLFKGKYGFKNVWHVPQMREIAGRADSAVRTGVVFIGSAHPPNMDGLKYFHDEILPLLPVDFKLTIVGEALKKVMAMKDEYKDLLRCPQFDFVGFVEVLGTVLDTAIMTVAPLRYGAGTKGKVASSMSYGVPCVSSRFGTEGTGMINGENILIASTPEQFAAAIRTLSTDPVLWRKLSDGGLEFLRQNYSRATVEGIMDKLLKDVLAQQKQSHWASTPVLPKV